LEPFEARKRRAGKDTRFNEQFSVTVLLDLLNRESFLDPETVPRYLFLANPVLAPITVSCVLALNSFNIGAYIDYSSILQRRLFKQDNHFLQNNYI
jgi:hypothetical protein